MHKNKDIHHREQMLRTELRHDEYKADVENAEPHQKHIADYGKDKVVSAGIWGILVIVLYVLSRFDTIGMSIALIILLIMSFTKINHNLKNFARASSVLCFILLSFELIRYLFELSL